LSVWRLSYDAIKAIRGLFAVVRNAPHHPMRCVDRVLVKNRVPGSIILGGCNDAGQLTRVTEDDGGIGGVTEFTYNGDGQTLTRTAKAPATGEGDQTTTYFYNTIDNTNGHQSAEKATGEKMGSDPLMSFRRGLTPFSRSLDE
jgi:YD repeat-containing protein